MQLIIDGHEDKLTVHLIGLREANLFKKIVGAIGSGTGAKWKFSFIKGLWMQKEHKLSLPPIAGQFKLPFRNPYLPCKWQTDVKEGVVLVTQWLSARNLSEFLFVTAPSIRIERVRPLGNNFSIFRLHPLTLEWVLPDPVPPLEVTDDMEQMLYGMLPVEGSADAAVISYLNYLRFETRRLSEGFYIYASRICIYHMLRDMHLFFRRRQIVNPLFVENDSGVRKLRYIASSDELGDEERAIAAGILSSISAIAEVEDPRDYGLPIDKSRLRMGLVRLHEILSGGSGVPPNLPQMHQ